MTSATALLARARAAGFRVTLLPDRRINVRPTPPPDLLTELRAERDAITDLLAAEPATRTAAPATKTPPKPRLTRPGALPGDPPAPVVDPEATRLLCILELAGTAPRLGQNGRLEVTHLERVSTDLRAAVREHQDDIEAILEYRALLEQLFPVSAEPRRPLP